MTKLLTVTFLLSLQLSAAAEAPCNTQLTIDSANALTKNGDQESAMNLLKNSYAQCPTAARLALEIGALYQLLGQPEAAIKTWQNALNEHSMPDSVRVNVQLRILALQQTAPEPKNTDVMLRLGTRYLGKLDDTAIEALANISRTYPKTHNDGIALSQWRHTVTALSQQYLTNDVQLSLLQASTEYRYSQQNISLVSAAGLSLQNGTIATDLTLEPSLRLGQTKTAVSIKWRTNESQWRITPSFSTSGPIRTMLSSEWRLDGNNPWRWHNVGSQIRWGQQVASLLSVSYDIADQALDTAAGLTLQFNDRWTIQTQWRNRWLLENPEHQWINTLTWRGSL